MRDGNPYRCAVDGCDEGPRENGLCYWHQPQESDIPRDSVRGKDHFEFVGNGVTVAVKKFRDRKPRTQFTCWYLETTDAEGNRTQSDGTELGKAIIEAKRLT